MPLVRRIRVTERTRVMLTLEAAISEALAIAATMSFILILQSGAMSAGIALQVIGGTFLVSAALGFITGVLWLVLLSRLTGKPFAYMITLGTLLLIYGAADLIAGGVGGGVIAALIFGLVLGNELEVAKMLHMRKPPRKVDDRVKDFNSEISFFVRTFFFVYLGLICSVIRFTWIIVLLSTVIFLCLVLVRYGTMAVERKRMQLSRPDIIAHVVIMPRGLVAAVLASLPFTYGVVSNDIASMILGTTVLVIVYSTAMASIGTYAIHWRFGGPSASAAIPPEDRES